MDYRIKEDMEAVMEISNLSRKDFADSLHVSRMSLSKWLSAKSAVNNANVAAFYEFAFSSGIRLNRIKEQLYTEDLSSFSTKLLFHGAKTSIEGDLSLEHSKDRNDLGRGFYCGESLVQSAMFVASYPSSSLYMLSFDPKDLRFRKFGMDRDWILTVAYNRGRLGEYADSEIIKDLLKRNENVDYYIAPIADNRMFEIIDQFIDGEITDVQCQHCLSATGLGNQYAFVSDKALNHLHVLEKCYLSESEKRSYLGSKQGEYDVSRDKVRLARRQYRNQGSYIEDILK